MWLTAGRVVALLLVAGVAAAMTPFDLDVEIPTGTPFDGMKIPKETPTGGKPNDVKSGTDQPAPPPPGTPGGTVAEDPKKVPPPKPPSGLPGIGAPSTVDYQMHLGWKPQDDLVEMKDPLKPDVATGTVYRPDVEKWDMDSYPPTVPNDLYVYCVTRYLMVMLHMSMVSERELTQFLIEMDYPAHYAATAAKGESRVKPMCDEVMKAVGPMMKTPPAKPADPNAQKLYMDLCHRYCYEADFGKWTLAQPTEITLPILLNVIKTSKHPFLVRNAIFILRCFNNPEVVPVLRDVLTKTNDKVSRNRALAALVRWQDESIVDWCVKAAGGPDVSFRSYALWALGRIGSPAAIDPLEKLVRLNAGDAEYLWAAIPALGWLGEKAVADKKKKVEDLLVHLSSVVPNLKDPPEWVDTAPNNRRAPDPPQARAKILAQRIRFALALCGRESEKKLVLDMIEGDVLRPNLALYQETKKKLQ